MSTSSMSGLQPLEKTLRKKLEATVKEARDVAESGALAALKQLEVGDAKVRSLTSDSDKDLRRRLRVHGRQLGDTRNDKTDVQKLDRLVDEIAYEHWHRMLFARFLAENNLLMYPDPDDPVSVSLDDCEEMAADEGAKNGWELAARFATKMLPQIFRVGSPVFEVTLPPEKQQRLEGLLSELPGEVFHASDSLGWVYQFWQAKRKDEVNASEVKIGARELPAVTQLFTEPYMVSFLLDNSLGAWWVARRLTEEDLSTATSEQELRDKAALPGVPLEYLRFVKVEDAGVWTPAAGTFDSWPKSLAELKTLDPCCGSGHFLVAALLMLVPMRMELEGLSAREAVDRVFSDNLHGLEIDQRCVELAAFALALAAWRFPEAGGYRVLPDLHLACCGLSVSVAKEEWKALAKDNKQLKIALDWIYDEFRDAPLLGSLFNPIKTGLPPMVRWEDVSPTTSSAIELEIPAATAEAAVVAYGLARAISILSLSYSWIITNVPYLARGKQVDRLRDYCETHYDTAKRDIATVFLARSLELCHDGGNVSVVLPQNWLFLKTFTAFREQMLKQHSWRLIARLGGRAFETISGEVVQAILFSITKGLESEPTFKLGNQSKSEQENKPVYAVDVGECDDTNTKAFELRFCNPIQLSQTIQLENPDSIVVFEQRDNSSLLVKYAESVKGLTTGDGPRFIRYFSEMPIRLKGWDWFQTTPDRTSHFDGLKQCYYWENGKGAMQLVPGARTYARAAWGTKGVLVSQMGSLPAARYFGVAYDNNCAVIKPLNIAQIPAIWSFCASDEFNLSVRKIDQSIKPTNATFEKIQFDHDRWQRVAVNKYPHGLPEPYSDDPTQWIFHGHPASSTDALQVAVARLLGYRWPAELDAEMELATDARAWIQQSNELTSLADNDGIVCIPAVGTEQPAEDRLLNLLHKAYEAGRTQEQLFQEQLNACDTDDPLTVDLLRRHWKPALLGSFNDWLAQSLAAADHKGKTLQTWLRDKFFTQHCKVFHHSPFIWQIWDGLKDGFSALINYHKLDNKLLKTLIYTYLNDWINRQKQDKGKVDGSEERLAAAESLKKKLEQILEGESPYDIFVRWKPLAEQPIGWNPDLNDGVRLNIRPWMTVDDVGKRGAGILRDKPNIKWTKDRGKDVESAPWYDLGKQHGGKPGDRINDHHLTLEEKKAGKTGQ